MGATLVKTFFDFKDSIDDDTEFLIFGIPWDSLSSLKGVDSANGPSKLREITDDLARTTEDGFDITSFNASDLGDIEIDPSNTERNLIKIEEFIKKLYNPHKSPKMVMIGGDHYCTYPVVKAIGDLVLEKEKFGVLVFDAHVDFYEIWEGKTHSHTMVSYRLFGLDFINNKNLLIVGTRDIDNVELENLQENKIEYINAYEVNDNNLQEVEGKIVKFFKSNEISKLYVSIDIDVLDPSIAPGTGYAIPGGLTYRQLWNILRELPKNFDVIGFDLVEVSPGLDLPNRITQVSGAKLIVEFMSFIANKI